MIYSRLIHDYLDVGLDEAKEQALFSELAVNSDLRYEFNSQVKLNNIANNDMSVISPPMETTNAIFSTLGFAIPNSGYEAKEDKEPAFVAATAGAGFGVLSFIRENLSSILSAVIAAALTSLLFLWLNNDEIPADNVAQLTGGNKGGTYSESASISGSAGAAIPVSSGREIPVKSISKPQNRITEKQTSLSGSGLEGLSSFGAVSDIPFYNALYKEVRSGMADMRFSEKAENSFIRDVEYSYYSDASEKFPSFAPSRANMTFVTYSEPFMSDKAIEIRSTSSYSDMNTGAVSSFNPAISMVWGLSAEHLLVASLGMEEFDLLIDRTQLGLPDEIQRKQLPYFSGNYRYVPEWMNIAGFASPFVQTGIVLADGGYGGKGMAGIKLTPENRVYFIAGYEYTYILYKNEHKFQGNNKRGFNIGVGYNF